MAKTKATKPIEPAVEPEIVEAPELALVETDGSQLRSFLGGLVPFFRTAQELELKAKSTLIRARELKPPANEDEDVKIQQFIKTAREDLKVVVEHWSITTLVHGLHRKLTSKRGLAEKSLEDARDIAQRHHNDYAEAERRKAALETERRRREAEEQARREQEAEAARLEDEALRLMEAAAELSEREGRFVELVVAGNPAPSSARAAGFKDGDAAARRLLGLVKIQNAITERKKAIEVRRQADAVRRAPVNVAPVEPVRPAVSRAVGAHDRVTHSAEVVDASALIAAVIAGKHGIPWDVLTVDEKKLTEYARSMHELINRWPGVQYKKTTTTV